MYATPYYWHRSLSSRRIDKVIEKAVAQAEGKDTIIIPETEPRVLQIVMHICPAHSVHLAQIPVILITPPRRPAPEVDVFQALYIGVGITLQYDPHSQACLSLTK